MNEKPTLHPIQLKEISVSKLSLVVNNSRAAKKFQGNIDLKIKVGTSEYEKGDPIVAVGIQATAAPKLDGETEPLFELAVELSGQFHVDYDQFKYEDLQEWSRVNAPFLLIPYVREHVYGMALRAGIDNLILPLLIQPRIPGRVKPTEKES